MKEDSIDNRRISQFKEGGGWIEHGDGTRTLVGSPCGPFADHAESSDGRQYQRDMFGEWHRDTTRERRPPSFPTPACQPHPSPTNYEFGNDSGGGGGGGGLVGGLLCALVVVGALIDWIGSTLAIWYRTSPVSLFSTAGLLLAVTCGSFISRAVRFTAIGSVTGVVIAGFLSIFRQLFAMLLFLPWLTMHYVLVQAHCDDALGFVIGYVAFGACFLLCLSFGEDSLLAVFAFCAFALIFVPLAYWLLPLLFGPRFTLNVVMDNPVYFFRLFGSLLSLFGALLGFARSRESK